MEKCCCPPCLKTRAQQSRKSLTSTKIIFKIFLLLINFTPLSVSGDSCLCLPVAMPLLRGTHSVVSHTSRVSGIFLWGSADHSLKTQHSSEISCNADVHRCRLYFITQSVPSIIMYQAARPTHISFCIVRPKTPNGQFASTTIPEQHNTLMLQNITGTEVLSAA